MNIEKLRSLLNMAHGPGVDREPEENRSPAGLATVYLGHDVVDLLLRDAVAADAVWQSWSLPRRVQATKVALALAHGVDPGEAGCAVSWRAGVRYVHSQLFMRKIKYWALSGSRSTKFFCAEQPMAFFPTGILVSDSLIDELSHTKALFLAVDYILENR